MLAFISTVTAHGFNPVGFVWQVRLLGKHTNHTAEEIQRDISRPKYFDAYGAVEYGIIDRVRQRAQTL